MLLYLLKRMLLFLPTIFFAAVITFGLSKLPPGDPVEICLNSEQAVSEAEYAAMAAILHLDKPVFYGNFQSAAYPDTLYRILKKENRNVREKMIDQYGNWLQISNYFDNLSAFGKKLNSLPDSIAPVARVGISKEWNRLIFLHNAPEIAGVFTRIEGLLNEDPEIAASLSTACARLKTSHEHVRQSATRWKLFLPDFAFHGLDNQFHIWITNFLGWNDKLGFSSNFPFISWESDWGISCVKSQTPVIDLIRPALKWTLILSLSSIFISFLIALPLGVYMARHKGSRFDNWTSVLLFLLFSVPVFWIATIMIVFFTTPEYGEWMNIFPSIGLEKPSQFILPVFCMSLGSLAYLSRQMRGGMIAVSREDYIRTAKAKGLSGKTVAWRHAFKNALFPIITIFAGLFPRAISGALVIEVIFNIPGMGWLVFSAIRDLDWPVVYAVLMLSAFLTMFGILFGDLLYAKLDPRVRFDKTT